MNARGYFQGNWGINLGIRYGRHEIGGHYEDYSGLLKTGGAYYRLYWPKNEQRARPYLYMMESSGRLQRTGESTRNFSLGIGLGAEYAIWRGLSAFYQIGLDRGIRNSSLVGRSVFTAPLFIIGLRYNLHLAGPKPESAKLSSDFAGSERVLLNLQVVNNPYAAPRYGLTADGFLNFEPSVEVRVNHWLRPFVGLSLGKASLVTWTDSASTNFALKGITVGTRLFTLVRPRWAFFEELSYTVTHRPKWGIYGGKATLGHGVRVKILPGLYANAMLSWQIQSFDEYFLPSAGLTISPGAWAKRNL